MKLRYWFIIEVVSGIGLAFYGNSIHNKLLFLTGAGGTMTPLFHNLFSYVYQEIKTDKELKRDKQYQRGILCSNCDMYNWFRIPIGQCIPEFLIGRHCKYCNCELRIPNEVSKT